MSVIWRTDGEASVGDVRGALHGNRARPLAYTTVMTVLTRLAGKEFLHRRWDGRRYLYRPAAVDGAHIAVRRLIDQFGDGVVEPFVTEARADPHLLRSMRRAMQNVERPPRRPRAPEAGDAVGDRQRAARAHTRLRDASAGKAVARQSR